MSPDHCQCPVRRKAWELPFVADPGEVAGLRRVVHLNLALWGLHDLIPAAQLCVSELAANVITHVGTGTQALLAVSMNGTRLRIEMEDEGTEALPAPRAPDPDAESGRGLMLLSAFTEDWGVTLTPTGKRTWCELATGLPTPTGHLGGPRVTRTETLLASYTGEPGTPSLQGPLAHAAAVTLIADICHWLITHGYDPDTTLDAAQARLEQAPVPGPAHGV
ncbi:ATP-binding protein [Streptomyces aidingensis]|uniref:Anti-sigma regulatory factor (Ser/Thr protein kinase) n=1 Tax=Streptomyces aidingensis TaxID=910347 RepID=A0A1I1TW00_9ACTN|nr:ATP-binding protein [Streptomyces aidingensis]SFD62565.1 Anti-sigma regulatory factor (Ser/Thr protein kinase) [Streptomyces aidingensis]